MQRTTDHRFLHPKGTGKPMRYGTGLSAPGSPRGVCASVLPASPSEGTGQYVAVMRLSSLTPLLGGPVGAAQCGQGKVVGLHFKHPRTLLLEVRDHLGLWNEAHANRMQAQPMVEELGVEADRAQGRVEPAACLAPILGGEVAGQLEDQQTARLERAHQLGKVRLDGLGTGDML
jgi:hypothetical protein